MNWWWVGVGGIAALLLWCEGASIPAWVARKRYRWIAWGIFLLLLGVGHKALLWHQELVLQIRLCP